MIPSIRVFIVDDHPLVREWLGNLLRMEKDIEITGEADEPEAALAAMKTKPPDVAVVDLSFKRGSGLDLIKAARSLLSDTRILVLSMYEEISDVERAFRAGASGYVMKRESTNQIVMAIRQVYSGAIYAAPALMAKLSERMAARNSEDISTGSQQLSDREMEVFRRLGSGHSTRRIADDLGVSQKTVQTYCSRIKEKLGLRDGMDLLTAAIYLHNSERSNSL